MLFHLGSSETNTFRFRPIVGLFFSSSCELVIAKIQIQIQIERIKNLSPLLTDEYYSETDEELADDQDEVLNICYDLKALIHDYFHSVRKDTYSTTQIYLIETSS